jgi:hypothetical protein
MAKKLSDWEFLDRHWRETEVVLSLFKNKKELQYAEIRKKLSLDNRSRRERNLRNKGEDESEELILNHETQLMRILKALCGANIIKKISKDKKVYYRISPVKSDSEEKPRHRIGIDTSYLNDIMEDNKRLEEQLESSKNRIYELNIEIGKLTKENIELKERLAKLES